MELVLTSSEKQLLSGQEILLFQPTPSKDKLTWWDGTEHSNSYHKRDWRQLDKPLPCGETVIEHAFVWNGASVGPLRFAFPKWKHPIATCRHDKRCAIAGRFKKTHPELYHKLRKFADQQFKKDVTVRGNWWEVNAGYAAVRLGAVL